MNKQKFEQTIIELDDLKNQEIQKTWQKVNKFYSEIFSTCRCQAYACQGRRH